MSEKNHLMEIAVQDPSVNKRRGRAYRRRRRRILEISQAEEELLLQLKMPSSSSSAYKRSASRSLSDVAEPPAPRILPDDRGLAWRAPRALGRPDLSAADRARLTAQLGYVPGNALRVTCRLGDLDLPGVPVTEENRQDPVAIQLYPLAARRPTGAAAAGQGSGGNDATSGSSLGRGTRKPRLRKRHAADVAPAPGPEADPGPGAASDGGETTAAEAAAAEEDGFLPEPFPTMFWLTHPWLRVMVSKLEVTGLVSKFEERLKSTGAEGTTTLECGSTLSHLDQMRQAHSAYGLERFQLLTESDMQLLEGRSWTPALDGSRGVAGISSPRAIKCLHAHTAHFVSRPGHRNIVGEWTMQEVKRILQVKLREQDPTKEELRQ